MSIMTQAEHRKARPVGPPFPKDLADFHLRWAEFRPFALELLSSTALPLMQTETLKWLIALSDRVGENDLRG